MGLTRQAWDLPDKLGSYQRSLGLTRQAWDLPDKPGTYQIGLGLTIKARNLPDKPVTYRANLGLTRQAWDLTHKPGLNTQASGFSDKPGLNTQAWDLTHKPGAYHTSLGLTRQASRTEVSVPQWAIMHGSALVLLPLDATCKVSECIGRGCRVAAHRTPQWNGGHITVC